VWVSKLEIQLFYQGQTFLEHKNKTVSKPLLPADDAELTDNHRFYLTDNETILITNLRKSE
jgi:hypothetical protein